MKKFNFVIARKREDRKDGKLDYYNLYNKIFFFGTRSNAKDILKWAKQNTTKLHNNAWKIYKIKETL